MAETGAADEEAPRIAVDEGLPLDRPWLWLEKGWSDFRRAPAIGLLWGLGLVAACWVVTLSLVFTGKVYLLLPLSGGFFIVAPLLVAGLYDTSRRLELGERPTVATALLAWRAPGQLALMGAVLLVLHLLWIRVALLLLMLFLYGDSPTLESLAPHLLEMRSGLSLLLVGSFVGAFFALVAFAISAVSIPMLIDKETSVIEAVIASVRVVVEHPRTMLFWGLLIVVFCAAGLATLFFGLAVLAPVIAHATWHAYRDTVP